LKPPYDKSRRPSNNKPAYDKPVTNWSPNQADEQPRARTAPKRTEWRKPASENAYTDSYSAKDGPKGKDDWKLKSPRKKFRTPTKVPYGKSESENVDGLNLLYGIHSVSAALQNPARKFKNLFATENGAIRLSEDGELPIEATIVTADVISKRLTPDAVHQGVLLEAEPLEPLPLSKISTNSIVLALDQVTDPHNVGAILRSCAAFNVAALIITDRHSPEVTGVLAKAASGALEHVPFATVRNLSAALDTLKERGFMVVGLDSEAPAAISQIKMQHPLVLVMGAEGKGLRQKTRETCTDLVRLDMPGTIKSLNVSNAAAIALYAVTTSLKS
jgi:23S rRNA (guanosine2251-2'-O)-methyltransferase